MSVAVKARALAALGLPNLIRVGIYRLSLKSRWSPVRRLKAKRPAGPFFDPAVLRPDLPPASTAWRREVIYFDARRYPLQNGEAPDWMWNPYTGARLSGKLRPWWQIPDFDSVTGDIKVIWEPSRFGWLVSAAERAAAGEGDAKQQLETWLADWCEKNPPYFGPNWKCGQEASIRVMHLATAMIILENVDHPASGLLDLLDVHLKRIEPTIQYAIGQDNNHGTSEASALFVGGAILQHAGRSSGRRYAALGRKLIDNRVSRLVAGDGSFSQYSLNYHRVFLDAMIIAETWRRRLKLESFSAQTEERLGKAAQWLFAMVDPETGDAPNLGANDGARLLPLTDTGYRDFRPCVQLSMALFCNLRAFPGEGSWDDALRWLSLDLPQAVESAPVSAQFDDGGYAILRQGHARAIFRYPRFRFRPAQSDALHVDLWIGPENLLRDAGTYSYNVDRETLDRFAGAGGHNTIVFDRRDQMPRLGRFLFGEWLKADGVSFDATANVASAGYADWLGASHHRSLALSSGSLTVTDRIAGTFRHAVLRWRLPPGNWRVDGNVVTDGKRSISVSATMPVVRMIIAPGVESTHYLEQSDIPVIEYEVSSAGTITSEINWS